MTKKKKIIVCVSIIIIAIGIFFVYNLIKPSTKEQEESAEYNEMLDQLSETSKKEELEFIEAEKMLKKMIQKNETMIEEYDAILNNSDADKTLLFKLVNTWNPALNFGGYRSGIGMSIYPLHYAPEDYYMFQKMVISLNPGEEILEHNIFFTKNFENISMKRYSLFIKGVFGVDISSEELEKAIVICLEKKDTVTQGSQFDYELYNKNNILIKMVAMEDVTGDKYVAICSRYTPIWYHVSTTSIIWNEKLYQKWLFFYCN